MVDHVDRDSSVLRWIKFRKLADVRFYDGPIAANVLNLRDTSDKACGSLSSEPILLMRVLFLSHSASPVLGPGLPSSTSGTNHGPVLVPSQDLGHDPCPIATL